MLILLVILIAALVLLGVFLLWRTTPSAPDTEMASSEEDGERIVDVVPPGSGP
jgi:hypothetical protein